MDTEIGIVAVSIGRNLDYQLHRRAPLGSIAIAGARGRAQADGGEVGYSVPRSSAGCGQMSRRVQIAEDGGGCELLSHLQRRRGLR
jgi:hypothetical protein